MKRTRKQSRHLEALRLLDGLMERAPEWLAARRIKGRWIGVCSGKERVILWQKMGNASNFPPLVH